MIDIDVEDVFIGFMFVVMMGDVDEMVEVEM